MTAVGRALTALVALALVPAISSAARTPSTARGHTAARVSPRDWSRSFAESGSGGFVTGNPNARLKVVEYGSLTCPHCRHFAQDAVEKFIGRYVRSGKVSYEFRPMVLNATDLAATLLARCGGPSRFFPIAATLYATQPEWTARNESVTEAELAAIPDKLVALRMAERAQLFAVARANGIADKRARACLVDPAAQTRITQIHQDAIDSGVPGTPYFLVNGHKARIWDWSSLQKELGKAGG
ncbi:MAG: thioredoxin domain-containing protein [Sphingomicrobium sp.]